MSTTYVLFVFLALLVSGLIGGVLPTIMKLKDKDLHLLLALGAGMLLGTVFLHMLPDSMNSKSGTYLVLIGLLVVFVVEQLVFKVEEHPETAHQLLGITAFFGLSIHAFVVGLGLSTQFFDEHVRNALLVSMIIHKLTETFALSTIFVLAGYSKFRNFVMVLSFSLVTPIAFLAGNYLLKSLPGSWGGTAAGLGVGTFLYVSLVNILPEVFHHPKGKWLNFALLLVGIIIVYFTLSFDGGHYGHHH